MRKSLVKKNLLKIFLIGILVTAIFLSIGRYFSVDEPVTELPQRQIACLGSESDGKSLTDKDLPRCAALEKINATYIRDIKPIFETKCLMCHGVVKSRPLYTHLYPIKWWTDDNLREAIKASDMRYDYPFGKPEATIKKHAHRLHHIEHVVEKMNMPPWDYMLMHWDSRVTPAEKEVIIRWVHESQDILKK